MFICVHIYNRRTMEFLTVQEFANKFKVSTQSVYASIKAGKIYACRPTLGKRGAFRIPITEVERLQIASQYERRNA